MRVYKVSIVTRVLERPFSNMNKRMKACTFRTQVKNNRQHTIITYTNLSSCQISPPPPPPSNIDTLTHIHANASTHAEEATAIIATSAAEETTTPSAARTTATTTTAAAQTTAADAVGRG